MGGNRLGHGGPEPPHLIHSQTFLVRKSNTRQCQALCVRLPEASGPSFVSSHYIQESPGGEEGGLEGKGWKTGRGGRFPEDSLTPSVSQASLWKAQSSCSRTWSSSSVHIAIPGESACRAPGDPWACLPGLPTLCI